MWVISVQGLVPNFSMDALKELVGEDIQAAEENGVPVLTMYSNEQLAEDLFDYYLESDRYECFEKEELMEAIQSFRRP